MNKKTTATTYTGIGFFGCLTIAFIVLKLCHVIAWSWVWVLAPLWMPAAIVVAALAIVAAVLTRKKRKFESDFLKF